MKRRVLTWIAAMSVFTLLAMPVRVVAQEGQQQQAEQLQRYTITDLGPAGGAPGQPITIAKNGLISGAAGTPDGAVHAYLWYKGAKLDIGNPGLGGANSVAFGDNDSVQVVGEAQTSTQDPNGEDFCGFKALGLPSSGTCLPFLWQHGRMTRLHTLGGHNGAANQINNRGEVAGTAENSTSDPACPAPQVLQFKPVIWKNGQVQKLSTSPGDPDGIAFAINDNGQVVGGSGGCAPFNPQLYVNLQPLHALIWEHGKVTDLGSLGGDGHGAGILALNVNQHGQVVGFSDLAGDTNSHGFLWTKATGMQDLGTLSGDVNSSAIGINDAGDVVGISLDAEFNGRAFVRRHGQMYDLNTIISGDSQLFLILACSINTRGDIIGLAVDTGTGELHGYLATPTRSETSSEIAAATAQAGSTGREKIAISENGREMLRRMRFGRLGTQIIEPQ